MSDATTRTGDLHRPARRSPDARPIDRLGYLSLTSGTRLDGGIGVDAASDASDRIRPAWNQS